MNKIIGAFTIALALAAPAFAQDGGKLAWKGKTEDPKAAMAEAKKANKAMMLFFTSEG
jgi:roadblock/LC7 domain-containing protein